MNTIQSSSPFSVFDSYNPSFKQQSTAVYCGRTINEVNRDAANMQLASANDLSGREGIPTNQRITISDTGRAVDINTAWDDVEHYLRDVINVAPKHLAQAKQHLNTLTSETFQYYEDVVDRLVALLNEQAGTDYPLMDEACQKHDGRTSNNSGVLWQLGKWMVMALTAQTLISRLPQASGAAVPGQAALARIDNKPITFDFLANSGNRIIYSDLQMTDRCEIDDPQKLEPDQGLAVRPGEELCLHDGNNYDDLNYYLMFNAPTHNSMAITTGHGRGDLSLYVQDKDVFDVNGEPTSNRPGNHECVVVDNSEYETTVMAVRGNRQGAAMVVDYDTNACRLPLRTGFADAVDSRTKGYPLMSAHLQVYVVNFADEQAKRPELEANLNATAEYFKHQSYGQFDVSWEAVNVNLPESAGTYTQDNLAQWQNRSQDILQESGIDPEKHHGNTLACLLCPQISDHSPTGYRSVMTLYGKESPGMLAHFMGHAMGLSHAQAIEGGSKTLDPNRDSVKEYGNVFSLMGAGWPRATTGEMNLMYKSFFGWIDPDVDVPKVSTSGRYRIYAFDQGEKPDGPMGIRLQGGDKEEEYWIEYRTTGPYAQDTRQGVLINLQRPREGDEDQYLWDQAAYMLDMTPNSKSSTYPDWWGADFADAALTVGKTYQDLQGGFTIRPHSVGGTPGTAGAYIDVDVVIPDEDDNPQDNR